MIQNLCIQLNKIISIKEEKIPEKEEED